MIFSGKGSYETFLRDRWTRGGFASGVAVSVVTFLGRPGLRFAGVMTGAVSGGVVAAAAAAAAAEAEALGRPRLRGRASTLADSPSERLLRFPPEDFDKELDDDEEKLDDVFDKDCTRLSIFDSILNNVSEILFVSSRSSRCPFDMANMIDISFSRWDSSLSISSCI